jgi:hypothetical protein
LVITPSGISIEGDASFTTPLGTFSVGASVPVVKSDEIVVILRDRKVGQDHLYRIRSGRDMTILVNGRSEITVGADGVVLIDITGGAVQIVEIKDPRAAEVRPVPTARPAVTPTVTVRRPTEPPRPIPTSRPPAPCATGRRVRTDDIPSPLSEVRGVVMAADGHPVAGARLRNTVPGYEANYCPETVTDASGAYNFAQLRPQPYRVTLLSPGNGQAYVDYEVKEYGHRYVIEFVVGDCP